MQKRTRLPVLFLFYFIFFQALSAQELKVGPNLNFEGQNLPEEAFLVNENQYLVLRKKYSAFLSNDELFLPKASASGTALFLDLMDEDLNLLKTQKLDFNFDKGPNLKRYNSVVQNSEGVYFLFTTGNAKTEQVKIFIQKLNTESLEFEGEPRLLQSVLLKQIISWVGMPRVFEVVNSPNGKRLAVCAYTQIDKKTAQVEITLLDEEMEKVGNRTLTFGLEEPFFNVVITNDGNIMMLKKNGKEEEEISWKLYHLDSELDQPEIISLEKEGLKLWEPKLEVSPTGNGIVGAFFLEPEKFELKNPPNLAQGWYLLAYNPSEKQIAFEKQANFGKKVYSQYTSGDEKLEQKSREKKNLPPRINLPVLQEIDFSPTGRIIMIGEHNYVVEIENSSNPPAIHNKHIVVGSFQTDGNLEWFRRLPKNQMSKPKHRYWLSFGYGFVEEGLVFVFNDNSENISHLTPTASFKDLEFYKIKKPKHTVIARISAKGDPSFEVLTQDVKPGEPFMTPRTSIQVLDRGLLLYARDPNKVSSKKELAQKYLMLQFK